MKSNNDHHSVHDYENIVVDFVRKNGMACWPEIFDEVENIMTFTRKDVEWLSVSKTQRWKKLCTNLRSNNVLTEKYDDIVRVEAGFATVEYVTEHNIVISQDNNFKRRKNGSLVVREIKMKPGKIIGMAWDNLDRPKIKNKTEVRKKLENFISENRILQNNELIVLVEKMMLENI